MSKPDSDYYVYVYIDPRNFQEFYYGKGRGDRKAAHLNDNSDSLKARTIKEIKNANHEPIIKVIAKGLTEAEAFLIEKTLIWKLGRNLANVSSGHYAENFRPHNTFHQDLYGFDYENGLYYVNVGEGDHRNWDDCRKYGFLSAGQSWNDWGRKMYSLEVGDVVAAFLKKKGYVGIGKVTRKAVYAIDFKVDDRPLSQCELVQPRTYKVEKDLKEEEHIVGIEWIKSLSRDEAVWEKGLFSNQNVVASLERQRNTISFLEKSFDVSFDSLLGKSGLKDDQS